jgi:flagellar biogenesis protein FliO
MVTPWFVISISGAIIIMLISALGWTIRKMMQFQEDTNLKINSSIEKLNNSVDQLNISVEKLKLVIDAKESGCIATHQIVDRRLNSHSQRLDKIEKDVLLIEAKITKNG